MVSHLLVLDDYAKKDDDDDREGTWCLLTQKKKQMGKGKGKASAAVPPADAAPPAAEPIDVSKLSDEQRGDLLRQLHALGLAPPGERERQGKR